MNNKYNIKSTKIVGCLLFVFLSLQGQDLISIKNRHLFIDSLQVIKFTTPNEALLFAFNILEEYPNGQKDSTIATVYNILGEIYTKKGLSVQALEYFIEAENEYGRIQAVSPWLKINMGNVYFQEKQWDKARKKYYEAYDIFVDKKDHLIKHGDSWPKNNLTGLAVALINLGMIEKEYNVFSEALKYYEQALIVRLQVGKPSDLTYTYLEMGKLYLDWDMNVLAEEKINKADSILTFYQQLDYDKYGSEWQKVLDPKLMKKYMGMSAEYKGILQMKYNNPDQALSFFIQAVDHYSEWPIDKALIKGRIGRLYMTLDEPEASLLSINEGINISNIHGLENQEMTLLEQKSKFFEEMNRFENALKVNRVIYEKRANQDARMNNDLLESVKLKSELYAKRRDIEAAKIRQILILISAGAIIIVFGITIMYYRSKKKTAEKEQLISEKEQILAETNLVHRENELTLMSTYIVEKNDMLLSLKKDLDYLVKLSRGKTDQRIIKSLQSKLSADIAEKTDWEKFQKQFTVVYPGFLETIHHDYPKFSSGDIKICCYLKMNQSTKEIAKLMSLSVRAIENRRYRIRKKMQLAKDINLVNFLYSLDLKPA